MAVNYNSEPLCDEYAAAVDAAVKDAVDRK